MSKVTVNQTQEIVITLSIEWNAKSTCLYFYKTLKNIYHVINYRHVEWGYLYLENLFVETLKKKFFFLLYTGHKNCV